MNKDHFWLLVKEFLIILVLVVVIRGFFLIPVGVSGNSMKDTLNPGDFVLMERFSKIKRFDVVVLNDEKGNHLIKRVVGLPGETLKVEDDTLWINGEKKEEKFLNNQKKKDKSNISYTADFSLKDLTGEKVLGKNEYFVMGDNRRISKDSRNFGPVKDTEIVGKARIVYFPIKRIRWIR